MKCSDCKYFKPFQPEYPRESQAGNCVRKAPTVKLIFVNEEHYPEDGPFLLNEYPDVFRAIWPSVFPDDGCGEFQSIIKIPSWGEMEFSIRIYNALENAGISSVETLMQFSALRLSRMRHLGPTSIREIRRKLGDYNLALASEKSSIDNRQ